MRLKLNQRKVNYHKDIVTASRWTPKNELFSCSDDRTCARWNMEGEVLEKVCQLKAYVTDMHWFPSIGKNVSDTFAVSCSDGTFRLMQASGREEKCVKAANGGAIISLRWNYDGSALVTAGENGEVKVWSRIGMLRNTVATLGAPVYAVVWGPDNDQLLFCSGRDLMIKTLSVDRKQLKWKAHDGTVLRVDWNPVNNLIVSGGEDRKYRVWDCFGRQMYCSQPMDYVVTCVSWCPNGEMFVVGAYNVLRLCDKTGWSYSREQTKSGSLMNVDWSTDGTQLAASGGNGAVVFGQVVERTVEWKNIEVTLTESNTIRVLDALNEEGLREDSVDFRDRVIEMSIGFDHLVVATATQCYIYGVGNFNTAQNIFDLPGSSTVNLIVQCEKYFLTVDDERGVQVFTYEGRRVSSPSYPGMRVELLNRKTVALSNSSVAILDQHDGKKVRVFDVGSGRVLGKPIVHKLDIVEVALSQYGFEQRLAFIDRNRDMYVSTAASSMGAPMLFKVRAMVDSMAWNDASDMLVALADGKLVCWYYPTVVFVDRDLLPLTIDAVDATQFGKMPQIVSFFGSRVTARRADGSLLTASVSPYPTMLYEFVQRNKNRWEEAVGLCRFVKSDQLWATLAAMAIAGRHLDTAEIALAAIHEVDKLHYVLYIKDIPSEEGKNAELALWRRQPDEAEKILMQRSPPLLYRAIKMNIRLFRWRRALDLAVDHKSHVDTVLYYRQQYLKVHRRQETDDTFKKYAAEVPVDEEAIKAKKAQEKENEIGGARGGGGGGGAGYK